MKFNIASKLGFTYLVIIIITLLSSVFCIYAIRENKKADYQLRYECIPSLENTKEMKSIMQEIKKLSNSWVYLSNKKDKDVLKEIMADKILVTHTKLLENEKVNEIEDEKKILTEINQKNAETIEGVTKIMDNLFSEDAYNNDSIVDLSISIYEDKVEANVNHNNELYTKLIQLKESNLEALQNNKERLLNLLIKVVAFMLILVMLISITAMIFTNKGISKPLVKLKTVISDVAMGEINQLETVSRKDEIGEMQNELSKMIVGLENKIIFSDEIGKGNYESSFDLLSENDKLGLALIDMRDNLKKSATEHEQRTWASSGLAEAGNILRATNTNSVLPYSNIINYVVKYLKANQGGLFLINDTDPHDTYLELVACYAYDRQKYITKRVEIGEGLLGQCYIEKEEMFLTDIPNEYTHITSGLGEATPTCIIIVPLMMNDVINGVMEIASFHVFEEYQIEFIKKLAESISSAATSLRVTEKTAALLAHSQQQTEEMKSQEEEMKQNLEEMNATQEDFQRKEKDYIDEIKQLRDQLANK